jgi:ketosteroid isomerase-like protein
MRKMFIALSLAVLVAAPAAASDQTDVPAVVQKFVDGFNKGDTKAAAAACADQTSIVDEFPPYEWHGMGACAKWMADWDADAKKKGITDAIVTLGTPRHVDVTGDRAYVVVPTGYAYKVKGAPAKQSGSTLTIALQKGAAGWRITGWTWTRG